MTNNKQGQPAGTVDFKELAACSALEFADLAAFDKIYFLGDRTSSFANRAASIAHQLPNFAGILVFGVSPEKRIRISSLLAHCGNWGFITFDELAQQNNAGDGKILVVDFNDDLAGKHIVQGLRADGVEVVDFLFAMHQLQMTHTYLTLKQERDYLVEHLADFEAVAERLGDLRSRQTLHARLKAILTLDRTPLISVNYPLEMFINNSSPTSGLVIRPDEVFVDVGAAYGDTVGHFFHTSRGQYRAMHAFEPDSSQFVTLEKLSRYLPNVTPYFSGVGEEDSVVDFYESPQNRFGSNFIEKSDVNQVRKSGMKIVKLDSVLHEATLIKIDVEGWEAQVLRGAARLISGQRPNLTVSAYHYGQDIPNILATVDKIHRYAYVGLRHHSATIYDTQMLFSDTQQFN
ncbi:MAG: FkbM family methyltransferase [Massilia sp.]